MITIALLREWNACWPDDQIRARFGDRSGVSPREISGLASVSLDDRLWVLCRALWYRDESAARAYAIDSAALVSHLAGRAEDQAAHAALLVDLRRIYALPADQHAAELQRWDAARAVARAVAWDAKWDPAWNAARNAAHYSIWAVHYAARVAIRDDKWDAMQCAARDAERQKAIDRTLIALGPDADGWSEPAARHSARNGAA